MMLADKLFFSSMIVIPLLIMVTVGYALRNEKLDIIPIAAVDEDNTPCSELLIERICCKEGISLSKAGREEAMSMLEEGRAEQIFIINKGFQDRVKKGDSKGLIELVSSPSSYLAGFTKEIIADEAIRMIMANRTANKIVLDYGGASREQAYVLRNEVLTYIDGLWEPEPLMTIEYKELKKGVVTETNQAILPMASSSSAGLIVAFVMFFILFGSGWLIEERTNGTIKRLGTGKDALAASFGGSILSLLAAGILQILLFSLLLRLLFGVVLFRGVMPYLLMIAYLLSVISIGMFLSTVLTSAAQLQAVAPVVALMTGFAGGCFWNWVEMPEGIARLSLLTPQGWALKGINSMLTGVTHVRGVLLPVLILLTAALILLPISYIIINKQLREG